VVARTYYNAAAGFGLAPKLMASKATVLLLDDPAFFKIPINYIWKSRKNQSFSCLMDLNLFKLKI